MNKEKEQGLPTFVPEKDAIFGQITDLNHPNFQLTEPLEVVVQQADGQYVATEMGTGRYGHGIGQEGALLALVDVILEEFSELKDKEDLGPILKTATAHWRQHIIETPTNQMVETLDCE